MLSTDEIQPTIFTVTEEECNQIAAFLKRQRRKNKGKTIVECLDGECSQSSQSQGLGVCSRKSGPDWVSHWKIDNCLDEDSDDADENVEKMDLEEPSEELLYADEPLSHKSFKDRALELAKKLEESKYSGFVTRQLNGDDWLYIHRIIRKSKGLRSKFMIRNLTPFLFDESRVSSWKCKLCPELIQSPTKNYVDHLKLIHDIDEDRQLEFPCDICGDYVSRDKYIVHWVPHFMEHECPVCKKTFALNCHMKYHFKVVHEEAEETCEHCGKLMKNDLAKRRHLRLFHSNRANWKICDICGKRVKSRCLEPHKLTHSQDRPYKCEICKKCFKTPSTLYQHHKVHNNDSKTHKYLCEYCGKRFKHHTSWNLHVVRIHEGEYEHKCPVCLKRFHKLFELRKHSIRHSDERPYPCPTCGKQFKTKTHLKEHSTIHSPEKIGHICPLCGKSIRMKANLYKHLKVHKSRGEAVPSIASKKNINNIEVEMAEEQVSITEMENSPTHSSTVEISEEPMPLIEISEEEQMPESEVQEPEAEYIIIDDPQLIQLGNDANTTTCSVLQLQLPIQEYILSKNDSTCTTGYHTIFITPVDDAINFVTDDDRETSTRAGNNNEIDSSMIQVQSSDGIDPGTLQQSLNSTHITITVNHLHRYIPDGTEHVNLMPQ